MRYRIPLRLVVSLFFVSAAAIAGSAIAAGDAAGSPKCRRVRSTVALEPVGAPTCTSSVGVCGAGVLRGSLTGTSFFVGSSLVPTVDTPATGVVLLTGDNQIDTPDGTLFTKDAIVLGTTGAGEFGEVDTVVGGTGAFAGATGVLTATGTFTSSAGGEARLDGEICVP